MAKLTEAAKFYIENNQSLSVGQLVEDTGGSLSAVKAYLKTCKEKAPQKQQMVHQLRGNEIIDSRTKQITGAIMTKDLSERVDAAVSRGRKVPDSKAVHKMR